MRNFSIELNQSTDAIHNFPVNNNSAFYNDGCNLTVGKQIITLNVGGQRFYTSRSTLSWIPDTFFTSLLSRRISSIEDDSGAIFIDRDPELFPIILNYLRTKHIDLENVNITKLKHEAEFYGISPLVKRIALCEEMNSSPCGGILFYAYIPSSILTCSTETSEHAIPIKDRAAPATRSISLQRADKILKFSAKSLGAIPADRTSIPSLAASTSSFNSSACIATTSGSNKPRQATPDSEDERRNEDSYLLKKTSERFSFSNFHCDNKRISFESPLAHESVNLAKREKLLKSNIPNMARVSIIRAHHNSVAVAYHDQVCCYRMKETVGWQLVYVSSRMPHPIRHIALVSKFGGGTSIGAEKMLAVALADNTVHLHYLDENNETEPNRKIGTFSLSAQIDKLFFIGNQLVALSKSGKVGIWHSMTLNWQVQDVVQISCFDTAGSVLLLGCTNGSIYYFDMQKFPLRMKDNDLLITELYRDPDGDVITAVSVYLTPKTILCGNWIEIAYGTNTGIVRVIVQHPETVGHGPQLFQTFTVHMAPITRIALTMNHLISVCGEYNHVRTWSMVRFRGMISTQPGGTSLASFKVLTLDSSSLEESLDTEGCNFGPYGDQDGEQVFVQRVIPDTTVLFVRLASNGDRLCTIRSVDGSPITAFFVHECEGMGARPRRFLFTGMANGSIQVWDLTIALDAYLRPTNGPYSTSATSANSATALAEKSSSGTPASSSSANLFTNATPFFNKRQFSCYSQGPSSRELLQLIDECELGGGGLTSTPSPTPRPSTMNLNGLGFADEEQRSLGIIDLPLQR